MIDSKSLQLLKDFEDSAMDCGATYNTKYEAYAVILEQIESAENELKSVKKYLDEIWTNIKTGSGTLNEIVNLGLSAESLCIDSVEIYAAANKFLDTERKNLKD